jgi:hypothetical protein
MYAASMGAVAPGAGLGPVEPLDLTRPDLPGGSEVPDLVNGWAEDFGKPLPVTYPTESIPAQAALEGNIAQVAALSIPDLLEKVDGLTVGTASGPVELHTKIATTEAEPPVTVRFAELGPIDRTLHAAASPTWIYVLLVLGLAALAFELTQPGFGPRGSRGWGWWRSACMGSPWCRSRSWGLGAAARDRAADAGRSEAQARAAHGGGTGGVRGRLVPGLRGLSDEIDISPWLIVTFTVMALLYWGSD